MQFKLGRTIVFLVHARFFSIALDAIQQKNCSSLMKQFTIILKCRALAINSSFACQRQNEQKAILHTHFHCGQIEIKMSWSIYPPGKGNHHEHFSIYKLKWKSLVLISLSCARIDPRNQMASTRHKILTCLQFKHATNHLGFIVPLPIHQIHLVFQSSGESHIRCFSRKQTARSAKLCSGALNPKESLA